MGGGNHFKSKMAAHGGPPAMPPLELTDEERAVLRECRVNSVYFRGIPLGAISVLIMREGIKTGYLSHVKRFSGFYYPGIFALGFLSGIASYRKTCMDKIMRLENSKLADQVREFYKKAGMAYPTPGEESAFASDDHQGYTEASFHDEMPKSSTNMNRERNISGSTETWTMANQLGMTDDQRKQSDRFTSYEELRRRNRNQWMNTGPHPPVASQAPKPEEQNKYREADDYRSPTDSYQTDMSSSSVWSEDDSTYRSDVDDDTSSLAKRGRGGPARMKNKYGDVLEK